MTKRSLVTVSHAIEQAAAAAAGDGPMVVAALFQRDVYYARERAAYARIAAQAEATVVAGIAFDRLPGVPGVDAVALRADEALAREWSVVALGPSFGAVLVAHDLEEVAPAPTLEAGRLFEGRWHFRRDEALHELMRLGDALAGRLPEATLATLGDVVERARRLPAPSGEARYEASIRLLTERLDRLEQRAASAPAVPASSAPAHAPAHAASAPAGSAGFGDEGRLRAWSGTGGAAAPGTMPLALVGIRLNTPHDLPQRLGRRTDAVAVIEVMRTVAPLLRPVDQATRLGGDDLLLTLPAATGPDAATLIHRLRAGLEDLRGRNPFVPDVTCVVLVTRERPLPLDHIRAGLDEAQRRRLPVATLGDSEAPERPDRMSEEVTQPVSRR
ncbi:DICT sensory domain-containing protein [Dactylosporangium sp. CA-139114]|uniref:DICT sensory domain-containing protein n=1 Tax=Dactylosporangium sp. CA-139114 TaxID=3239931 RepID=UPI003D97CCDA